MATLKETSGRDRAEWFEVLDEWGAPGREYAEIAAWLTGEQGLSKWWAQKLIVEYEQDRGLRGRGARPDGTFAGGASKTLAVPVSAAYDAFVDPARRERWLPGVQLTERPTTASRSARFDVADGTRLAATFDATGDAKCQVAITQEGLPTAEAAEQAKLAWRDRLAALKADLEA
ncbi:hypothetical protein [Nocardioides speluncae]|uniref:hypothetical protein n=1 Tax=Nocardioides speluncae TaxID=2670337 RepID=UPI000D68CE9F|nr:hypothetical protein [Nocardioides speluncae]